MLCGGVGDCFEIQRTEVTQALYEVVMENDCSPCYSVNGISNPLEWNYRPNRGENLEEILVCSFESNGFRLPTEAEWEFAASCGGKSVPDLENESWYHENSGGTSHEVGSKKSNGFGLYDMIGNVSEWCVEIIPGWLILRKGIQLHGLWQKRYKSRDSSGRKTWIPDCPFVAIVL